MSTRIRSKQVTRQESAVSGRILVSAAIFLVVAAGLAWWLLRVPAKDPTVSAVSKAVFTPHAQPNFEATIVNSESAPASSPEGMVYIPGGEFSMGSLDPTQMFCGGDQPMEDARPLHRVVRSASNQLGFRCEKDAVKRS